MDGEIATRAAEIQLITDLSAAARQRFPFISAAKTLPKRFVVMFVISEVTVAEVMQFLTCLWTTIVMFREDNFLYAQAFTIPLEYVWCSTAYTIIGGFHQTVIGGFAVLFVISEMLTILKLRATRTEALPLWMHAPN